MAKRLYFERPDVFEFEANIVSVMKDGKLWKARLDRTYFFPEGGGQPSDRGWIDGVPVTNVQEEKEHTFHYLPKQLKTGPVKAKIDKKHRYDYMQQHTGQHIISAALWKIGQYKTISVHMGESYTTIDIESSGISTEHLRQAEEMANRIINENTLIDIVHTDPNHLHEYPLRKPTSVVGDIRLVHIHGFDYVGCCGFHLGRTGLVGLVKCTGKEKIRGDTRLVWKIGSRAYQDYDAKMIMLGHLRTQLGIDEGNIEKKVTQLLEENARLKRNSGIFENRVVELLVKKLIRGSCLSKSGKLTITTHIFHNEDQELLKKICKRLIDQEATVFCVTNQIDDKWYWSVGCSENLQFDFSEALGNLLDSIDVKGGGRHPLWQGVGFTQAAMEQFVRLFKAAI